MFMALPTLSPQQRAAALEKASETRQARAAMLEALKTGEASLPEVLGRSDDVARKTRVTQVLKALPGYGPARVQALMSEAGVDDHRRVGGLGEKQRRRLIDAVAG